MKLLLENFRNHQLLIYLNTDYISNISKCSSILGEIRLINRSLYTKLDLRILTPVKTNL